MRDLVAARTENCPGKCDGYKYFNAKVTYIVRVLEKFKGKPIEDDVTWFRHTIEKIATVVGTAISIAMTSLLAISIAIQI